MRDRIAREQQERSLRACAAIEQGLAEAADLRERLGPGHAPPAVIRGDPLAEEHAIRVAGGVADQQIAQAARVLAERVTAAQQQRAVAASLALDPRLGEPNHGSTSMPTRIE